MNNNKKVKENNKSEEKKRGNITGERKKKNALAHTSARVSWAHPWCVAPCECLTSCCTERQIGIIPIPKYHVINGDPTPQKKRVNGDPTLIWWPM